MIDEELQPMLTRTDLPLDQITSVLHECLFQLTELTCKISLAYLSIHGNKTQLSESYECLNFVPSDWQASWTTNLKIDRFAFVPDPDLHSCLP